MIKKSPAILTVVVAVSETLEYGIVFGTCYMFFFLFVFF